MRYPLFLRITAMMLTVFLCIPLLCGCSEKPTPEVLQTETVPAETEPSTDEYLQPEPSVIVETLSLKEAYDALSDGTITRTEFFRQPDARSQLDAFYDETITQFLQEELTELPGIETVSPALLSSYQIDSGVPHLVGFAEQDSDCFLIPCAETVLQKEASVVPETELPIFTDTEAVYSLDFLEIRFSEQFNGDTLIFTPTSIRFGKTFDSLCSCIPDNAVSVRLFQDTWSYGTAAAEYLYIETDNDFELRVRYLDSLDFRKIELTVPEEKRYDRRWINVFQPCYDRRYNTSVITVGLDDGIEWEYLTYNFVIPEVGYPSLSLNPIPQPMNTLVYVHYARRFAPAEDVYDRVLGILHPIEFPNRNSSPVAETLAELDTIGFREDDPRLQWVKAFLAGNTAWMEYLSGVPEGLYAPFGTMKTAYWYCYRDQNALIFMFYLSDADCAPFPNYAVGNLNSFTVSAYPWGTGLAIPFTSTADTLEFAALTDLLDNTTLTVLPSDGKEFTHVERSSFTEYLCQKLCTDEVPSVSAEELASYAESRFSVKNFVPAEDHGYETVLGETMYQPLGITYPKRAYQIMNNRQGDDRFTCRVQFYADPSHIFSAGTVTYQGRIGENGSVVFRSCTEENDVKDSKYPPYEYK